MGLSQGLFQRGCAKTSSTPGNTVWKRRKRAAVASLCFSPALLSFVEVWGVSFPMRIPLLSPAMHAGHPSSLHLQPCQGGHNAMDGSSPSSYPSQLNLMASAEVCNGCWLSPLHRVVAGRCSLHWQVLFLEIGIACPLGFSSKLRIIRPKPKKKNLPVNKHYKSSHQNGPAPWQSFLLHCISSPKSFSSVLPGNPVAVLVL